MDYLQFPPIPLLLAFFLFIFMAAKLTKPKKISSNTAFNLPPGPRPLPLIGNIHNLVSPLPHHTLRDLALKYGALIHLQLGQVSTVVVSSPEVAKHIFKTHDVIFSDRPYLLASRILSYDSTNIVFSPYGDYWRQMRKICVVELLSAKRVEMFRGTREEEVLNLIRSILSGSEINLSKKIFSLSYGITSRAAFGKKSKDQDLFVSIIEEAMGLAGGFSVVDMYPKMKVLQVMSGMRRKLEKLHKILDRILGNIIEEHRERNRRIGNGDQVRTEDLVDVLLKIQRDGDLQFPLSDDNIKAVILDIFAAGSETSATVVEWAMSEMLKNPGTMKRAQAEVRQVFDKKGNVEEAELDKLNYLHLVIKETLRLHPSAPLLVPRECSERCEINGYHVPAKAKVLINAWAIGRDPKYWTEPDKFEPERFKDSEIDFKGRDFEFIPFGAGRRICPGMWFSLPSIGLPLAQLLYHFDWELPGGAKKEELGMGEAFGLTVRGKNDLCLVPSYYPCSQLKKNQGKTSLDKLN